MKLGATSLAAMILSAVMVSSGMAGQAPTFVKVWVHSDASLSVDGHPTNLAQLDVALADAAKRHEVVMYYRDNPSSDPSPKVGQTAHSAIDLVANHRLPVCFAVDANFSACRKLDQ